jgi:hypothetical protein
LSKKILITFIGFIILFSLSIPISPKSSFAAPDKADDKFSSIKICGVDKLNDYLALSKAQGGTAEKDGAAFADLQKSLNEDSGDSNALKIRVAFEKAREKYHNTAKCVFDVATVEILGSAGGLGENLKKDSLPDLTLALADLNVPDKVCPIMEKGKLKSIINGNNPENLVPSLLTAYNNYSALVTRFIERLKQVGTGKEGSVTNFEEEYKVGQPLQLLMENEIQDSIIALDSAFEALKELRVSFVLHVHFECMLKNLALYQRLLGNLRSIVTVMPSVISDASTHR